jgi:hypothetical protein
MSDPIANERMGKAGGLAECLEPILYMMSKAPHHDALRNQRRIERPCPERSQRPRIGGKTLIRST